MGRRQVEAQLRNHGQQPVETLAPPADDPSPTDAKTQATILHPDGETFAFSFGELKLYPMAMWDQRQFAGFIAEKGLDAQSAAGTGASFMDITNRIVARINRNQDDQRELFYYAAKATGRPGSIPDQQAEKIADQFFAKADRLDTGLFFMALCKVTGLVKAPDAKNTPARRRR